MAAIAFLARNLYTPEPIENGVVVVEDGRIVKAGPRAAVEVPTHARQVRVDDGSVAPGFIDIHNHGAGGRDVMEARPESFATIRKTLARFGTTSFYPTTMSAPTGDIRKAVEFLADAIEQAERQSDAATQPLGIHMEGPYLSEKRRGAHPTEYLAEPTLEAYRKFAAAARGRLSIMTIAPELAHAPEVMEEMIRTGVHPSIGHTDATFEEADRAARLGVRQATHMFNAMRPFGHRDPGVIAKVLTDARIKAELIADCVHVDPRAMELLYRAKGPDGIVLISDGISAVGMPDGEYMVGDLRVMVKDGVCLHDGTLAGSVLTLSRAVRNMRERVGAPTADAIRMATLNTARLMGVDDRKGTLKSGADADLVILDEALAVRQVYVRGRLVE
jgi:N-acetylglucosamine-6-phosphate deacetylase